MIWRSASPLGGEGGKLKKRYLPPAEAAREQSEWGGKESLAWSSAPRGELRYQAPPAQPHPAGTPLPENLGGLQAS